eukprot:maker-scaffold170_size291898-snap-gene-1.60 protein:Tk03029 transcript:maker-scaffold170_size291898-snap-gene-1.60-mRNA-1 annotation:"zn-dependent alcohol dehydrogenase"
MAGNKLYETLAWGKKTSDSPFEKITIERSDGGPDDVDIDIKYCGVCHSDVHAAQDDFAEYLPTAYPCVVGHEIAGIVTKVGANVKALKVGDQAGVGSLIESCLTCKKCTSGSEVYCSTGGPTFTIGGPLKHGLVKTGFGYACGGFSKKITVHERFAVKIPSGFPLSHAGPIFCAGITMFSPLKHWGADTKGSRVGILGIGGLGQMGIRLASAMGCEVTAVSTSPNKEEFARSIGAKHFVVSSNPDSIQEKLKSLDLILDTISAPHDINVYLPMLDNDGTVVLLGPSMEPQKVYALSLLMNRISISGSATGGMPAHQECIDFCHKNNIQPSIELIKANQLDEVFDKLAKKSDSAVRYVLDIEASQ